MNPLARCGSNDTSLCYPQDLFIGTINNRIQKYSLNESFAGDQGAGGITVASQGLIAAWSIFVHVHIGL